MSDDESVLCARFTKEKVRTGVTVQGRCLIANIIRAMWSNVRTFTTTERRRPIPCGVRRLTLSLELEPINQPTL